MKIRTEHKNIGAALMQIAEHDQFTAINAMKIKGTKISNAFKINDNTGILCKYASEPNASGEYLFTFNQEYILSINAIKEYHDHTFVVLACIEDTEICILSFADFNTLIESRKNSAGEPEESYQILVTVEQGNSLRAYVNAAGRKGKIAGNPLIVPRKDFPNRIFS